MKTPILIGALGRLPDCVPHEPEVVQRDLAAVSETFMRLFGVKPHHCAADVPSLDAIVPWGATDASPPGLRIVYYSGPAVQREGVDHLLLRPAPSQGPVKDSIPAARLVKKLAKVVHDYAPQDSLLFFFDVSRCSPRDDGLLFGQGEDVMTTPGWALEGNLLTVNVVMGARPGQKRHTIRAASGYPAIGLATHCFLDAIHAGTSASLADLVGEANRTMHLLLPPNTSQEMEWAPKGGRLVAPFWHAHSRVAAGHRLPADQPQPATPSVAEQASQKHSDGSQASPEIPGTGTEQGAEAKGAAPAGPETRAAPLAEAGNTRAESQPSTSDEDPACPDPAATTPAPSPTSAEPPAPSSTTPPHAPSDTAGGLPDPAADSARVQPSTTPPSAIPEIGTCRVRCAQVLFGYRQGQKQVAWTPDLPRLLRDELHDVLAKGMRLVEGYPGTLTWFSLHQKHLVLAIALEGCAPAPDYRRFPSYGAFLFSLEDAAKFDFNPLAAYRQLLTAPALHAGNPEDAELPVVELDLPAGTAATDFEAQIRKLLDADHRCGGALIDAAFSGEPLAVLANLDETPTLDILEGLLLCLPPSLRREYGISNLRVGPFDPAIQFAFGRRQDYAEYRQAGVAWMELGQPPKEPPVPPSPYSAILRAYLGPDGANIPALYHLWQTARISPGRFAKWDLAQWATCLELGTQAARVLSTQDGAAAFDLLSRARESGVVDMLGEPSRQQDLHVLALGAAPCLPDAARLLTGLPSPMLALILDATASRLLHLYRKSKEPAQKQQLVELLKTAGPAAAPLLGTLGRADHKHSVWSWRESRWIDRPASSTDGARPHVAPAEPEERRHPSRRPLPRLSRRHWRWVFWILWPLVVSLAVNWLLGSSIGPAIRGFLGIP